MKGPAVEFRCVAAYLCAHTANFDVRNTRYADACSAPCRRVVPHGETEGNKTRTIAGDNAGKLSALGVTQ